jgi:GNAT superfamily N-acetyltransferase
MNGSKPDIETLSDTYVIREITKQNIEKIHQMCERNKDFYPIPLDFFIRGTLEDSGYIPELCVAIYEKSDEHQQRPIGYFHVTKRKGWVIGTRVYIKSFMIDRPYRRKGIATWALQELMKRAKKRFPRSTIHFGACNPDYWFPGVDTRHTAALFFLYKMGFKKHGIIQSLTVHLEQFKNWTPITERNGYTFRRASAEDLPALKEFVKKNFLGTWHLEAELSFKNNPPTTFIALDPDNKIVGFSSHSVGFPSAYGPIGVNKAIRGQRLGDILLKWCMWDILQAGYSTSIIMWVVGDTPKFYSKTIGAYIHPVYYSLKRWL